MYKIAPMNYTFYCKMFSAIKLFRLVKLEACMNNKLRQVQIITKVFAWVEKIHRKRKGGGGEEREDKTSCLCETLMFLKMAFFFKSVTLVFDLSTTRCVLMRCAIIPNFSLITI